MKKFLADFGKRLSSRKFILAFATAIIVFGNNYFEWNLKIEEVILAISGFLAFIGVEGWADARKIE